MHDKYFFLLARPKTARWKGARQLTFGTLPDLTFSCFPAHTGQSLMIDKFEVNITKQDQSDLVYALNREVM